jgi:hypothetical protein
MSDEEPGVHDHEVSSRDRKTFERRSGVDLSKDGSGMLGYIAAPQAGVDRLHYHMFAESVDVRDSWLVGCAHGTCSERAMIPLDMVEVWKRAATPHQIWLLNWQTRCEITLANVRKVSDG